MSDLESDHMKNLRDGWKGVVEKMMAIQSFYLRSLNISRPAFFILHHLDSHGPESLVRISHVLQVTKSTITSISDNLEKEGLVRRIRNGMDRRSYLLEIEPKGREMLRKISDLYSDMLRAILDGLERDEIKALEKAIGIMKSNLENMEANLMRSE